MSCMGFVNEMAQPLHKKEGEKTDVKPKKKEVSMSALVRYNSPVESLSNWFDDFMDGSLFEAMDRDLTMHNWPKVDIVEEKDHYLLRADLPGMDKKDVSVVVEKDSLRIEGHKKEEKKKEKGRYSHFERTYGQFSRSFVLPDEVNAEKIEASMKNGVLELRLPKREEARRKSIEVKIN